ncbi:hypothetical protein ACTFIW_003650 [Dictyostelium discoideum]
MCVPDWLETDVAIKLNTQTDISECREAITELVLDNAGKFSRRRPSDYASNTGEKLPMEKNHAVPNHNSHCRNSYESQADYSCNILENGDDQTNLDIGSINIETLIMDQVPKNIHLAWVENAHQRIPLFETIVSQNGKSQFLLQ